jgi:hypothetical protein
MPVLRNDERYPEHPFTHAPALAPVLALALAVALAVPAVAQESRVKPSQTGTVSQEVGNTKISITYDRPVARGRELFGSLVKWGDTWTPGANWATTIDFSKDVTVQGQPLSEGTYSIWSIPQENEWTLIFSKQKRAFHTRYPAGEDALRVQLKPTTGEHMETLSYYFPVVGPDSTILRIHWGTTVVPVTIRTKQ